MALDVVLQDVVDEMVESLREAAEREGVDVEDIRDLFSRRDVNGLDDLFNDGGEVRCEHFADLAWDYAGDFGDMDSSEFSDAQGSAIEEAMRQF